MKPKTLEQIKDELYELSQLDVGEVMNGLEEIVSLSNELSMSPRCRKIGRIATVARNRLEGIQRYLSNYPTEEKDRTGQPIG